MGCCVSKREAPRLTAEALAACGKDAPAKPAGHRLSAPDAVLGKSTPMVHNVYEFISVLSKDVGGTTTWLVKDRHTGEQLACRSIPKRTLNTPEDVADVQHEVQVLHHLAGHKHIVMIKGAFEDKHAVHIVTEYCEGGELFQRIVDGDIYTEDDAAQVFRTLVSVVQHCHSMGVMHRDIRPENLLLSDATDAAILKVGGFKLATFFTEDQIFKDLVGKSYLVAPEVLRRSYGKEADMWSCGVILYILLSGVPPFRGDNEYDVFNAILESKIDFESDPWPSISEPAKDCVRRMLVRDPYKRATPRDILEHEWIKENGLVPTRSAQLEPEVLIRLRNFAAMNNLKKQALKIIAGHLPAEEIVGLKQMFCSIDTDGSGTITIEELRDALRSKGSRIPESELQRILNNADVNGDGILDYEEFVAATMHACKLQQEENLYRAFQHFDKENSGYITVENLKAALLEQGDSSPDDVANEIEDILDECDRDQDGRIDYEEFSAMMRQGNEKVLRAASTLKYRFRDFH